MSQDETFDLSNNGKPTCCETTIPVQKCYLAWGIKNFEYCRQGYGDSLPSCIFGSEDQGSQKFRLDLYPRGKNEYPNDTLKLVTDKDNVRALVKYVCFIYKDNNFFHKQLGEMVITPGAYSKNVFRVNRQELFSKKGKLFSNNGLIFICALQSTDKEVTGGNLTMKSYL